MTPAEAHLAAVVCEQRIQKLSVLADKIAKARDILDDLGPPPETQMGALVSALGRIAFQDARLAVALLETELSVLRAELSRLVTLASGSGP